MNKDNEYAVVEIFDSLQGEGFYTGTPMRFIRLHGCSVGKKICHACDTDFDKLNEWNGGGFKTPQEILARYVGRHICITGGEPFDHNLRPLCDAAWDRGIFVHVETSGTREPTLQPATEQAGLDRQRVWLAVSPKPGFQESIVALANEIKVIVGGLGNGPGWPTLHDALRWADEDKLVYLQPRNGKHDVDASALRLAAELCIAHPKLRLSVQTHKTVRVQ